MPIRQRRYSQLPDGIAVLAHYDSTVSHTGEDQRVAPVRAAHSFRYRGHRIVYVDHGSGQPILFVHNGGASHRLWDYQLSHFKRCYRVIAPDLLGYGQSDRPDMRYSAEDYVAQVEQLVDHLEVGRLHLVGCCLGGGVVLEYSRRHPERVLSVAAIGAATPATIAAGPLARLNALSRPGSRLNRTVGRLLETAPGRWAMLQISARLQYGERTLADPSFREHARQMCHHDGQWRVFVNTDYSGFGSIDELSHPEALPPTLMMWGRDNPVLKDTGGEALAAALQPERSEFWDGCGYMLMRERPGETNRVLAEFFEAHGA